MCVCVHAFCVTSRDVTVCLSVLCLFQCLLYDGDCVFMHSYKQKRKRWSIKGTVTWRQSAEPACECVCARVFVGACQPVPARYPSIQPAPGTLVHPTRRTVALFISEMHRFVCVCVCCVYVCGFTAFGISLNIHTHIQQTQTHTYRFPWRVFVRPPTFPSPQPAALHLQ